MHLSPTSKLGYLSFNTTLERHAVATGYVTNMSLIMRYPFHGGGGVINYPTEKSHLNHVTHELSLGPYRR